MGDIDRVIAGGNAGLVGADTVGAVGELAGIEGLAAVSLHPVGVALAVGTGLFLAGAYAYKHWALVPRRPSQSGGPRDRGHR